MRILGAGVATALAVFACSAPTTPTISSPAAADTTLVTSAAADAFLDEALSIMQAESLSGPTADWESIEAAMRVEAAGSKSPEDTYLAIELGLRLLDSPFGVFVSASDVFAFEAEAPGINPPIVESRPEGVGYIATGEFFGDPGPDADAFAADLAVQIAQLDPNVCGWILDLGVTRFGISEPILGGLAPLIDRGPIGGFTHTDGSVDVLENNGSGMTIDGAVVVSNSLTISPESTKPIAVIIGSLTGLPGEVTMMALKGQNDIQFIGQPTSGATFWIDSFFMSDGSAIALATAQLTDRLGDVYDIEFPLRPDTETANPNASEQVALDWLTTHPSCQ